MKNKDSGKKDFLSEAEELLEEITTGLHELDLALKHKGVRPELINKLFREFHSLKGISGMLGYEEISNFTHELENMLDHLRLGRLELNEKRLDLLFQATDVLNRMLNAIQMESTEHFDLSAFRNEINVRADKPDASEKRALSELKLDDHMLQSLTEYEEHRLTENLHAQKNIYSIQLSLSNKSFDRDLRSIQERLTALGEIISTLPYFDPAAPDDRILFKLIFATGGTKENTQDAIGSFDSEIADLRLRPTAINRVSTGQPVLDDSLRSMSNTVRVDIEKLDDVINVIGELVISRTMITNLSKELLSNERTSRYGVELSRAAADLDKKLNDLQHRVIETRLVSVGQIYRRLSRMVRKISRETGKQVRIQFSGEDTQLDKIMIEQISDPLMHVIRNAIDHGIESPDERSRLGKPAAGLIQVNASQRGNNVLIQIQDDGRGIQMKRIQEHARRRGLISRDRVLDRPESLEMIFRPGFSSSEQVTELSGRGVGLDVVKRNISELKGSIAVFTEENRGTLFEITLPITLAIIQALIVRIRGTKYALPLSSVSETLRIFDRDVQTVDRKEVYHLRDKTIPLIFVDRFFGYARPARKKMFMIVVRMAGQLFGLVVDELVGQQEIIIKSMGEKLKNVPGIAGAAEIGEKKPILVLDPESMIEEVTHGKIRPL